MGHESVQLREIDKVKAFQWAEQKNILIGKSRDKVCLSKPGTCMREKQEENTPGLAL